MAIQDDAKQFFLTELSRSQGDLPSLQLEWLASEGYTRGSIDERWSYYLRDNGQPPTGVSWDLLGLTRNKGGGVVAPDVYDELFAGTLGSTFTSANQVNIHRIAVANMAATPPSGSTKIKIVVQGNVAAAAVALAAASGDLYDAAGAYTAVTFGGAAGLSGKAATDLTESDEIDFVWDAATDLLVGLFTGSAGAFSYTNAAGTGKRLYYKGAAVLADLTVVNKTGYTDGGNALWGLQAVLTNGFEPLF